MFLDIEVYSRGLMIYTELSTDQQNAWETWDVVGNVLIEKRHLGSSWVLLYATKSLVEIIVSSKMSTTDYEFKQVEKLQSTSGWQKWKFQINVLLKGVEVMDIVKKPGRAANVSESRVKQWNHSVGP